MEKDTPFDSIRISMEKNKIAITKARTNKLLIVVVYNY